jgi:hypothetical protein
MITNERERIMRLSSWLAIVTLGFCLTAADPIWAKDSVSEAQKQGPYTQAKLYQIAAGGATIGGNLSVPDRPVLKVENERCEARIKRWKRWFRICLKECEDIAASYTAQSNTNARNSPVYRKELNECLDACNSKNDYYKNDMC